jgi:hypothetical protein
MDWIRIWAGRTKSRIIDHFFCDLEFLEFLWEIGFSKSLKKVPNRPLWMANLPFMALSMEKGKKGLFTGPSFFGGRMVQPRKVSVATMEHADGERYGGGCLR